MNEIITADVFEGLRQIPDGTVDTCVTSPPYYGLRDYGAENQIGAEPTPEEYIAKLVEVFREVRRVLKDRGTLWLNIGDSYAGSNKGRMGNGEHTQNGSKSDKYAGQASGRLEKQQTGCKPKDLIGIPWMLAFALRADGWYLRQDIIWHKPNPMPESVCDRCVKAHEYVFLLSKERRYYFDHKAIQEPAKYAGDNRGARPDSRRGTRMNSMSSATGEYRNKRDVWTLPTKPYKGAHFAAFPPDLVRPCIRAGAPQGGIVLDPFCGSGTTGATAVEEGRGYIMIDAVQEYTELAQRRVSEAKERSTPCSTEK